MSEVIDCVYRAPRMGQKEGVALCTLMHPRGIAAPRRTLHYVAGGTEVVLLAQPDAARRADQGPDRPDTREADG